MIWMVTQQLTIMYWYKLNDKKCKGCLSLVFYILVPSAPLLHSYSRCRGSFYAAIVSACMWVEAHHQNHPSAGNVLLSCSTLHSCRLTCRRRHHPCLPFAVCTYKHMLTAQYAITVELPFISSWCSCKHCIHNNKTATTTMTTIYNVYCWAIPVTVPLQAITVNNIIVIISNCIYPLSIFKN